MASTGMFCPRAFFAEQGDVQQHLLSFLPLSDGIQLGAACRGSLLACRTQITVALSPLATQTNLSMAGMCAAAADAHSAIEHARAKSTISQHAEQRQQSRRVPPPGRIAPDFEYNEGYCAAKSEQRRRRQSYEERAALEARSAVAHLCAKRLSYPCASLLDLSQTAALQIERASDAACALGVRRGGRAAAQPEHPLQKKVRMNRWAELHMHGKRVNTTASAATGDRDEHILAESADDCHSEEEWLEGGGLGWGLATATASDDSSSDSDNDSGDVEMPQSRDNDVGEGGILSAEQCNAQDASTNARHHELESGGEVDGQIQDESQLLEGRQKLDGDGYWRRSVRGRLVLRTKDQLRFHQRQSSNRIGLRNANLRHEKGGRSPVPAMVDSVLLNGCRFDGIALLSAPFLSGNMSTTASADDSDSEDSKTSATVCAPASWDPIGAGVTSRTKVMHRGIAQPLSYWRRLRFIDLSDTRVTLTVADAIVAAATRAAARHGLEGSECGGKLLGFNVRRTPAMQELLVQAGLIPPVGKGRNGCRQGGLIGGAERVLYTAGKAIARLQRKLECARQTGCCKTSTNMGAAPAESISCKSQKSISRDTINVARAAASRAAAQGGGTAHIKRAWAAAAARAGTALQVTEGEGKETVQVKQKHVEQGKYDTGDAKQNVNGDARKCGQVEDNYIAPSLAEAAEVAEAAEAAAAAAESLATPSPNAVAAALGIRLGPLGGWAQLPRDVDARRAQWHASPSTMPDNNSNSAAGGARNSAQRTEGHGLVWLHHLLGRASTTHLGHHVGPQPPHVPSASTQTGRDAAFAAMKAPAAQAAQSATAAAAAALLYGGIRPVKRTCTSEKTHTCRSTAKPDHEAPPEPLSGVAEAALASCPPHAFALRARAAAARSICAVRAATAATASSLVETSENRPAASTDSNTIHSSSRTSTHSEVIASRAVAAEATNEALTAASDALCWARLALAVRQRQEQCPVALLDVGGGLAAQLAHGQDNSTFAQQQRAMALGMRPYPPQWFGGGRWMQQYVHAIFSAHTRANTTAEIDVDAGAGAERHTTTTHVPNDETQGFDSSMDSGCEPGDMVDAAAGRFTPRAVAAAACEARRAVRAHANLAPSTAGAGACFRGLLHYYTSQQTTSLPLLSALLVEANARVVLGGVVPEARRRHRVDALRRAAALWEYEHRHHCTGVRPMQHNNYDGGDVHQEAELAFGPRDCAAGGKSNTGEIEGSDARIYLESCDRMHCYRGLLYGPNLNHAGIDAETSVSRGEHTLHAFLCRPVAVAAAVARAASVNVISDGGACGESGIVDAAQSALTAALLADEYCAAGGIGDVTKLRSVHESGDGHVNNGCCCDNGEGNNNSDGNQSGAVQRDCLVPERCLLDVGLWPALSAGLNNAPRATQRIRSARKDCADSSILCCADCTVCSPLTPIPMPVALPPPSPARVPARHSLSMVSDASTLSGTHFPDRRLSSQALAAAIVTDAFAFAHTSGLENENWRGAFAASQAQSRGQASPELLMGNAVSEMSTPDPMPATARVACHGVSPAAVTTIIVAARRAAMVAASSRSSMQVFLPWSRVYGNSELPCGETSSLPDVLKEARQREKATKRALHRWQCDMRQWRRPQAQRGRKPTCPPPHPPSFSPPHPRPMPVACDLRGQLCDTPVDAPAVCRCVSPLLVASKLGATATMRLLIRRGACAELTVLPPAMLPPSPPESPPPLQPLQRPVQPASPAPAPNTPSRLYLRTTAAAVARLVTNSVVRDGDPGATLETSSTESIFIGSKASNQSCGDKRQRQRQRKICKLQHASPFRARAAAAAALFGNAAPFDSAQLGTDVCPLIGFAWSHATVQSSAYQLKRGNSKPLHLAAGAGKMHAVAMLLGAGAVDLARQRHSLATASGSPGGLHGNKLASGNTVDDPEANSASDINWALSVCSCNDVASGQPEREKFCRCSRGTASDAAGESKIDSSGVSNPSMQHPSDGVCASVPVDTNSVCERSEFDASITVARMQNLQTECAAAACTQTRQLWDGTAAAGTMSQRQSQRNGEETLSSATTESGQFSEGYDALMSDVTSIKSTSSDDDTSTGSLLHFRASLFATESHGRTPLIVAAGHGQVHVAALLLRYGPGGEIAIGARDAIALDGTPAADDALCLCDRDQIRDEQRETKECGYAIRPSVHQLKKWLQDAGALELFEHDRNCAVPAHAAPLHHGNKLGQGLSAVHLPPQASPEHISAASTARTTAAWRRLQLRRLLRRRGDLHMQTTALRRHMGITTHKGATALCKAAERSHVNTTRLLLANGASAAPTHGVSPTDGRDHVMTPLYQAIGGGPEASASEPEAITEGADGSAVGSSYDHDVGRSMWEDDARDLAMHFGPGVADGLGIDASSDDMVAGIKADARAGECFAAVEGSRSEILSGERPTSASVVDVLLRRGGPEQLAGELGRKALLLAVKRGHPRTTRAILFYSRARRLNYWRGLVVARGIASMMALAGINDACIAVHDFHQRERDHLKNSNCTEVLDKGEDKIAAGVSLQVQAQIQARVVAREARQASEWAAFLDTRVRVTATGRLVPSAFDGCGGGKRGLDVEALWEGIAESDERENLPHANMRTKTGLTLLQIAVHGASCTDCRPQRSRHRHQVHDRRPCKCGKEQTGQHEAVASVLLAFHACPHACDHKGRTALHVATTRRGAALLLRWCAAHNAVNAGVRWPCPVASAGKDVDRVAALRAQHADKITTPSALNAIGSKPAWRRNAAAALMARDRDQRTPLMTCVKHQYDSIAAVLLQPKLIPVDQVREALQLRTTYLQHRRQFAQQQHGSAAVALSDRMHGNSIDHVHGNSSDADRMETQYEIRNSSNNSSSETPPSPDLAHILIDYIRQLDTQAAVLIDGDAL